MDVKNQVDSSLTWDIVDLRIPQPDSSRSSLTSSNKKFSSHLLSSFNLSPYAKNHSDWHCYCWLVDIRILQPHWLRAFWLTQELEVSHIWDLCRYKANNMNFYLTPNPKKGNDRFFRKTLENSNFISPKLCLFQF